MFGGRKAGLLCLLLTVAAAAAKLPSPPVHVSLENISLASVTSSKVQLSVTASLVSTRSIAVEEITFDQMRAGGVPFYAAPISERIQLTAKQKLTLPKPLLLTIYLRDLDNLQRLRALVGGGKVSVTGVAYASVELNPVLEVLLSAKRERISIPIADSVELQVPGGILGRKAALALLDAAEAGWNRMGSTLQNAAKAYSEWRGHLPEQYSSVVVLAYASYDLTGKKGASAHLETTATGFRLGGRQVLLPKSVLEPWKFDPKIAASIKHSSMKVSGYDLWIIPANGRLRDDSNQLAPDKAWRLSAQQLRLVPSLPDDMEETFVAGAKNPVKVGVHRQRNASALGMVEITDPAVPAVFPTLAETNGGASAEPLAMFRFPEGVDARDARPGLLFVSASSAPDVMKLDEMIDSSGWGSPLVSKSGIVGVVINQNSAVPMAEVKRLFKIASAPEPAIAAGSDNRLVAFISDLHLGVGRDADGKWSPTEDSRWPLALQGLLDYLSDRGQQRVDLVMLGDMLELWQPPKNLACKSVAMDSGCTVEEMKQIVSAVIAAHPNEITSLKNFARQGDNRLYIVPGNHDAALLVPEIWQLLAAVLTPPAANAQPASVDEQGSPAGAAIAPTVENRVRLVESGIWSSPDGKLVAEHGHQIGSDVNRYDRWPQVTATRNGQTYIVRSWGEHFVQSLFNEEEREYPLIDNLIPESVGARYRIAEKGMWTSARDALRFLAFDTFESSGGRKQPTPEAMAAQAADAISSKARLLRLSYGIFAGQLAADSPLRKLVETNLDLAKNQAGAAAIPASLPGPFMANDLKTLCANLVGETTAIPCGSLFGSLLLPRAEVFRTHLIDRRKAFPQMTFFIYGHTHQYENPWPVQLDGSNTVQVLNTGAFQRLIDEPHFLEKTRAFPHPYDGLKKISLEELSPCYSAVIAQYNNGAPEPQVVMWRMPEDGDGKMVSPGSNGCN